jgi:hypothetical protein
VLSSGDDDDPVMLHRVGLPVLVGDAAGAVAAELVVEGFGFADADADADADAGERGALHVGAVGHPSMRGQRAGSRVARHPRSGAAPALHLGEDFGPAPPE